MDKKYSEIIGVYKLKKLNTWRSRYSAHEYPYKVALNLLYDLLIVEKIWDEMQVSIEMSNLGWGKTNFKSFNEAHGYVLNRCDSVAGSKIRSIVIREYKIRDSIADFNWASTRDRVIKAQDGNNKEVQKLELAYYYFTCGVELIYAWLGLRFLGTDHEIAFSDLTGLTINGVNYKSYKSLLNSFGRASGVYYKPLPNLFRKENIPNPPIKELITEPDNQSSLYSILK
ncbi:MAG: hypothetical protein P4L35_00840 [Ignavibacteriaceae bacterium]|nr:hypothetical protein [Ignavibacteriaceae bacterium]